MHYCDVIKNWVGGPVAECPYHRRLDKNRPLIKGANTLGKKKT